MTRYLWRIRIIPYVCWHRAAEKNGFGGGGVDIRQAPPTARGEEDSAAESAL